MKTVGKTLLVVLLSIAALGLACSDQSSPGKGEAKDAEVKKVPLDSIYSTNGQQGLKPVDREQLGELYELAQRIGASNVFMARGDAIAAARDATWRVFRAPWHPVDEPVDSGRHVKSDEFWLVAYLGVGGKGGGWLVKSAVVKGTEVRLSSVKGTPEKHVEIGTDKVVRNALRTAAISAGVPFDKNKKD